MHAVPRQVVRRRSRTRRRRTTSTRGTASAYFLTQHGVGRDSQQRTSWPWALPPRRRPLQFLLPGVGDDHGHLPHLGPQPLVPTLPPVRHRRVQHAPLEAPRPTDVGLYGPDPASPRATQSRHGPCGTKHEWRPSTDAFFLTCRGWQLRQGEATHEESSWGRGLFIKEGELVFVGVQLGGWGGEVGEEGGGA